MPNGKCFRPYRLPGKYCCIVCRELKGAEEFYKDSSRYNGCCSRCQDCDNKRRNEQYHLSKHLIEKRVADIKSDGEGKDLIGTKTYTKTAMRDAQGLPVWIEKTI